MKILGLLLFAASTVWANEPTATRKDSSCSTGEAFDTGYRLTENSLLYAGKCINNQQMRPILDLKTQKESFQFENYHHDKKFWQAQVPKNSVDKVYFQVMRFAAIEGVTAAHTQVRFVLNQPVVLQKGSEQSQSQDVLVSFEAAFPQDVSYNFALGAFPNYARFAHVMSTAQKQSDSKEEIEQYELDLSTNEKNQLLEMALQTSEKLGVEWFYNTLRPNCTTEVFDLIDQLPRFKDKQAPFLTLVSADPIAGPSIEGLKERNILLQRVQDFSKEQKGISEVLSIPDTTKTLPDFLPTVSGHQWALQTVLPEISHLSRSEQEDLKLLQKEILAELPKVLQTYGSLSLLSDTENQGLFLKTFQNLLQTVPQVLQRWNSRLPKEDVNLGFYFSPIAGSPTSTDLRPWGLPAALPFALISTELGPNQKPADFYHRLNSGVLNTLQNSPNKPSLLGLALSAKVQRDQSLVSTQILAKLEPLEQNLPSETPQVNIEKVVVPATAKTEAPVLLLTHQQNANASTVSENLDVQFGAYGGVAGSLSEYGIGSLQIFKDANSCELQTQSTPYFQGKIGERFSGFSLLDPILKDRAIQFHLTRLGLNLETQKIDQMNLSIKTLGLQCLKSTDANQQFTEQANSALQDWLNQNKNPLQQLSPLLSTK